MKKDKKEIIKKALENSTNSYEDKIALLRYITKNSTSLSSVVSNVLKKK